METLTAIVSLLMSIGKVLAIFVSFGLLKSADQADTDTDRALFMIATALFLTLAFSGCGGTFEDQWRAPPPCYAVLVTDCADGSTLAPLCDDAEDCARTGAEMAELADCETVGTFERITSCDGVSAEGCERIAEWCW